MDLIEKPAPTEAEILEQFEATMFDALRVGLTSIHDADTSPDRIAFYRKYAPLQIYLHFMNILTLCRVADEGRLPVRPTL